VRRRPNQKGQAVLEYILLSAIIMGMVFLVLGRLKSGDYFFKNFTAPLVQYLKFNYKYGDQNALGWDESDTGGPRRHIQISTPNDGQTFRMFIPRKRGT